MGKFAAFVAKEIREAMPATILFLVLFHLVALTRAVAQSDFEFDALRASAATIGALLVAKAILVVQALPLSRAFEANRLAHLLWKTLLFTLVVLAFKLLEELIHHWLRHESFGAAIEAMRTDVSWPVFGLTMMWLVVGLLLYCVIDEFVQALGSERVRQLFSMRSIRHAA